MNAALIFLLVAQIAIAIVLAYYIGYLRGDVAGRNKQPVYGPKTVRKLMKAQDLKREIEGL